MMNDIPSSSAMGITLRSVSTQFRFEDHYMLGEQIAKGSFGVVSSAIHKVSKEEVAVKVILREKLSSKDKEGIFREVEILKECTQVPGIVRLLDFYSSPEALHVVQVYAKGGVSKSIVETSSAYDLLFPLSDTPRPIICILYYRTSLNDWPNAVRTMNAMHENWHATYY